MWRGTTASHEPDYVLFGLLAGLLAFGLLVLTSASAPVGYERFSDSYFFIKRQLLYGVVPGIILFFFFAKVSYRTLLHWATIGYIFVLACLILVFIPGIGSTLNTAAHSWIQISSYSIQPAELAKLAVILFLAAFLGKRYVDLNHLTHGFLVMVALGGLPIVLTLLQPDIGTAIVLFSMLFGILFLAGARGVHLAVLAGIGIVGFAVLIAVAPYRAARLTTFLHPELDPQGIGYHINQAYMAIGSGGIFGLGLGHSRQKFQYLPEVQADSIYAVIAEEMGFLFAAGFVVFLCVLAWRIMRVARGSEDPSARIIAGGIMVWFLAQSFFNIGAMVGLLPLTGLPLPFVSHGGTALLVTLAAAGILVNVSKYTQE